MDFEKILRFIIYTAKNGETFMKLAYPENPVPVGDIFISRKLQIKL